MQKIHDLFQKNLKHLQYRFSLRFKIQITFAITFFVLFLFMMITMTRYVSHFVEQQLLNSATEIFNQTNSSVQSTFFSYERLTLGSARSKVFDDLMSRDLSDSTAAERLTIRQEFEKSLYSFIPDLVTDTPYRLEMKIYFNDEFCYFNNQTNYYDLREKTETLWVKTVLTQYGINRTGYFLLPGSLLADSDPEANDKIVLVRVIMDKNYYPHVLALLRLDIPTEFVNDMITTSTFVNTLTAIIDNENEILACSNNSSAEDLANFSMSDEFKTLPEGQWSSVTFGGEEYMIRIKSLEKYGLIQCTLIPTDSLYHDFYLLRRYLYLSAMIIILISFPLISYISKLLTSRILRVVTTMRQVKDGSLSYLVEKHESNDEIGELVNSYNYMVSQIQFLMDKEYEHGQEIKMAELRTLQAQINPHFLYNTLDMIYWMAIDGMDNEIQKAVSCLGTFYRIGLSNGQQVITLSQELEHASSYMNLWNLRLHGTINYSVQIPHDLEECQIIKTTIQPLLENAVSHGILEKKTPVGNISVSVTQEKDQPEYINITVTDDGVGIPTEVIETLSQETHKKIKDGHGFGICNVESRLKLFYGNDCGLTFYNNSPGTTVVIRIRKITG